MRYILCSFLAMAVIACKGPKGDAGPMGLPGPATTARVLLKTYTGTITVNGNTVVDVPEILNNAGKTIVEAYWAFGTVPAIYTKMADGWLDDTTTVGHVCGVSYTYGKVYLNYMTATDLYRIDVYTFETTSMAPSQFGDRLLKIE